MQDNPLSRRQDEFGEELPRHISVKLLRFINRDVRKFWRTIRLTLPQASEQSKELAEQLPEVFAAVELDNDLRDRREVYLAIAQFLKDNLHQPLPICLNAVHILCQEENPLIQEDGAVGGKKLIEAAQDLLVIIQVHYEPQSVGIYKRKIEIYFLKEGVRKVKRDEESLEWDNLPQHIREARLRQQNMEALPITLQLYPKER